MVINSITSSSLATPIRIVPVDSVQAKRMCISVLSSYPNEGILTVLPPVSPEKTRIESFWLKTNSMNFGARNRNLKSTRPSKKSCSLIDTSAVKSPEPERIRPNPASDFDWESSISYSPSPVNPFCVSPSLSKIIQDGSNSVPLNSSKNGP